MAKKSTDHITSLMANQRSRDLQRLREFCDSLPTGSIEKPGVIRAIEVLQYLPLQFGEDDR